MKVFIHIGMSKSGSSAIQTCMMKNRGVLKENGIYYPVIGIPGSSGISHHDMAMEVKEGQPRKLRKALRNCECNIMVLSCEAFWLLGDETVKTLRHELQEHKVEIVFYLRSPYAYLPSSYRQKIKRAGETCSPKDYYDPTQSDSKLNFSYQLKRWGKHFPLRVRAYEAVKHQIEIDFLKAIGAPIDLVDTSRRIVNATPSDRAIRLMLLANRHLPGLVSRYVRRLLRWAELDFDFVSPIEDDALQKYAKKEVKGWDKGLIKEHLTSGDWQALINNRQYE